MAPRLSSTATRLSSPKSCPTKPPGLSHEASRSFRRRGEVGSTTTILLSASADGGGRTHTTLRSLDFESSASANSATSAHLQGRMVDRFSPKRKGFVAHFHNHASIAPTAFVALGVGSQRKKMRTGSVDRVCLGTLITFGRSLRCRS
jgi:hypothetical protein